MSDLEDLEDYVDCFAREGGKNAKRVRAGKKFASKIAGRGHHTIRSIQRMAETHRKTKPHITLAGSKS